MKAYLIRFAPTAAASWYVDLDGAYRDMTARVAVITGWYLAGAIQTRQRRSL